MLMIELFFMFVLSVQGPILSKNVIYISLSLFFNEGVQHFLFLSIYEMQNWFEGK